MMRMASLDVEGKPLDVPVTPNFKKFSIYSNLRCLLLV